MKNHSILSQEEFGEFWPDLRDVREHDLGTGFVKTAHHPLYGPIATIHDGDRIGLVCRDFRSLDAPGRPSHPMQEGGAEWARLVAIGAMMAG